jgi:hypothetical protein
VDGDGAGHVQREARKVEDKVFRYILTRRVEERRGIMEIESMKQVGMIFLQLDSRYNYKIYNLFGSSAWED